MNNTFTSKPHTTYTVRFNRTARGNPKTYIDGVIAFPAEDWEFCQGPERILRPQAGEEWEVVIQRQESFPDGSPFYRLRPVRRLRSGVRESARRVESAPRRPRRGRGDCFASNAALEVITHAKEEFAREAHTRVWVSYEKSDPYDLERTRAEMLAAIVRQRPFFSRSFSLISEQIFDRSRSEGRHVRVLVAYFEDGGLGDFIIPPAEVEREQVVAEAVSIACEAARSHYISPSVLQLVLDEMPACGTPIPDRSLNLLNEKIWSLPLEGEEARVLVRFLGERTPEARERGEVIFTGLELGLDCTASVPRAIGAGVRVCLSPGMSVGAALEKLCAALTCRHQFAPQSFDLRAFPSRQRDALWRRGLPPSLPAAACQTCGMAAVYTKPASRRRHPMDD